MAKRASKGRVVKAWGHERDGKLFPATYRSREIAMLFSEEGDTVVRVEIRVVEPKRRAKR